MRWILKTVLILALGINAIALTYPCTCSPPSYSKAYRQANAVFLGQVTTVEEAKDVPAELKGLVFFRVKFKVEKLWKGKKGEEVTILTDQGWVSCGGIKSRKYREGEKYLVYAYDKTMNDYGCSRSAPLDKAAEDIKRLNSSTDAQQTHTAEAANRVSYRTLSATSRPR